MKSSAQLKTGLVVCAWTSSASLQMKALHFGSGLLGMDTWQPLSCMSQKGFEGWSLEKETYPCSSLINLGASSYQFFTSYGLL